MPSSNIQSVSRFGIDRRFIFFLLLLPLFSCATIKQVLYTYDPLNFHIVQEGILYRSAQPSAGDLRRLVEAHRIKSVINLRGAQPGESWYDIEKAVSDELGLKRVDIAMSVDRLPHKDDLLALLDAFDQLPRPILIHCKAGADRTGEAAAIFGLDYLDWSLRKASGQLHPFYGHFPDFVPSKTYFVRDVYRGAKWARASYDPCREDYKYYDKGKFCGAEAPRPFSLVVDDER